MRLPVLAACVAVACAAPVAAAPSIALQNNVGASFDLPSGRYTNDFYVDVGSESRLRLELAAGNADVDLLLRYGAPFPDTTFTGIAPSPEYLFEQAHYRSAGPSGTESIDLSTYNWQPVRAGRWYVSVVSFAAAATPVTLTARVSNDPIPNVPLELVFDDPGTASDTCNIAPWNDATARAPIAGNPGTTLGAQRRNALTEAARIIGAEVKSPVPLRVRACWDDLGTGNSVTLAQAGPQGFFLRDTFWSNTDDAQVDTSAVMPWLPRNYTLYPSGPASKLAGTRLCAGGGCDGGYDVGITFNTQIDTPNALGAAGFHYGYTAGPANGDVDFISVSLHEMTHGLGFAGLLNKEAGNGEPIGARAIGYDDVYDANAVRLVGDCFAAAGCQALPLLSGTDADRSAALVSITGLRWGEAAAVASTFNPNRALPAPTNLVPLYAPDPIQPGSTLSHIANATPPGGLMLPQIGGSFRTLGLALPMIDAIGWSGVARVAPAPFEPLSNQYYDVTRNGHGIDFSRVAGNIYSLTLYTYGANGEPEWYIAAGPMLDGVFRPAPNANGDTLVRYRFVAGGSPQQVADGTVSGQVRLDFNGAGNSPACNDGVAGRDLGARTAVMTWSIGPDRNRQWCMQPLVPDTARPLPDFTGGWASSNAADSGWGFSFLDAGASLFGLLYYPDAQGNGRWAYLQTANFASGAQLVLRERRGYCRTCETPADVANGRFDDVDAGNITLTFTAPNAGTQRASFTVNYQRNPPAGTFTRDTAIVPLTETRQ